MMMMMMMIRWWPRPICMQPSRFFIRSRMHRASRGKRGGSGIDHRCDELPHFECARHVLRPIEGGTSI